MMRQWWKIGVTGAVVAVIAWVLASGILTVQVGTSGDPAAAAPEDQAIAPPSLVAIAIGQLEEDDGMSSTVDLRAAIRDGEAGGALRFFCEEAGYYNGGVRTLSVDDGVISVTGGGGLFRPDGSRIGVRYQAQFSTETGKATISVHGRDYEYTMSGRIDGLVTVWEPPTTD